MPIVDHVAILVPSVELACERLGVPCDRSAIDEFPDEGTRELYVGDPGSAGRLLLMQPIGPGPYESAMRKRGPGLHHVAFAVADLSGFCDSIAGSGWLLHPASLSLAARARQVWLCRPGVRTLLEVTEGAPGYRGTPLVSRVRVQADVPHDRLFAELVVAGLEGLGDGPPVVTIGDRDVALVATLLEAPRG